MDARVPRVRGIRGRPRVPDRLDRRSQCPHMLFLGVHLRLTLWRSRVDRRTRLVHCYGDDPDLAGFGTCRAGATFRSIPATRQNPRGQGTTLTVRWRATPTSKPPLAPAWSAPHDPVAGSIEWLRRYFRAPGRLVSQASPGHVWPHKIFPVAVAARLMRVRE